MALSSPCDRAGVRESPSGGADRAPRAPANTATKRILIVEDEAIVARDIACTLEELGYAVVGIVHTSTRAVELARAARPDLILMDIRLPGGRDGIQTAALIREEQAIPIVYLTANTDGETLERALATAPGGYLAKPFDSRSVHATIEVALRRSRDESRWAAVLGTRRDEADAMRSEVRRLSGLVGRLRRDSMTDALTGLYNRRGFDETFPTELAQTKRLGGSLGLIMFDVDHFKRLNDQWGHQAGDDALRSIGRAVRTELREHDDAGFRYGGEEFVVLAPSASLASALSIAERLRRAIACLSLAFRGAPMPPISASFGVAALELGGDPTHASLHEEEVRDLLGEADAALLAAKRGGRNRVVPATGCAA